jgi:uncharacterized cupredoxin-like copper-binding protein
MTRAPLIALVAAIATSPLLAGCGGVEEAGDGASAGAHVITVAATEFALEPADTTIDATGTVTIHVVNEGGAVHALAIEGNGLDEQSTGDIQPDGSADLTVSLSKGSYTIYCPIDGHRARGMEGAIGAGGAAAKPETKTDDPDSDGSGGYGSY